MASRGRSARQKGNSYERLIAQEWRDIGFSDCLTTRESSRRLDALGIDLVGTGDYAVQIKRFKNYVPVNTIEEICGEFGEECGFSKGEKVKIPLVHTSPELGNKIPIVITKADREEAMAIMRWSDLRSLIKRQNSAQKSPETRLSSG